MNVIFKSALYMVSAIALVFILIFADFHLWRNSLVRNLHLTGVVAQTALGPMEYQTRGRDDAEITLLLLHGTTGGFDQSQLLADWLGPEDDIRTVAISRPGYLRTSHEVGMSPTEAADAFVALMDSLSIQEAAVMGWSGGGPMTVALAEKYPERINGLILLSTQVKWAEKSAYFKRTEPYKPLDASIVKSSSSIFGPEFYHYRHTRWYQLAPWSYPEVSFPASVPNPEENRERYDRVIDTTRPAFNRTMGMYIDAWNTSHLDIEPTLSISVPTLIVHSPDDSRVSFEQAGYAAEKIPGADLLVIEDESHYSTLNDFASKKVKSFLRELE